MACFVHPVGIKNTVLAAPATQLHTAHTALRNTMARNGALNRIVLSAPLLLSLLHASPLFHTLDSGGDHSALGKGKEDAKGSATYFLISIVLVILGGVFAGLTLGLMGQDEIYLKVISTSGTRREKGNAQSVLALIARGKHWVLVTLLLSNVITNETLPIVLDRCLGGGAQAVVSSTVLIVIFGEIIPQSLCVKYGLQVGAFFAPFVLVLMYLMYPVAYPIAYLLDYLLGEDHGTVYKKSGLKTLVTLHRTMGVERLTQDEVTIISAVLDLKEKKVKEIMTPIENVFTMSADRTLDEKTVEEIFNSGFSRIPIYLPNEPTNFIGMLLVRILISYDPEDCLPVSHFPLATLPETSPNTSCLNILNYFQEGKSHMCVVSQEPGSSLGAIGVLTLEDVIEELIGEEIVDESDVFVDIHQRIMREQPGPLSKRHITSYLHHLYTNQNKAPPQQQQQRESQRESESESEREREAEPQYATSNSRRKSGSLIRALAHSENQSRKHGDPESRRLVPVSSSPPQQSAAPNLPESHLHGSEIHNQMVVPSNLASNPLNVNKSFVTIKKPTTQHGSIPTPSILSENPTGNTSTNGNSNSRQSQSQSQEVPNYGSGRTTPSLGMTRNERDMMRKHIKASQKAADITKSTGEPIQVTTSVSAGESFKDRDSNDSNSQSMRDNKNVMISSSYKSTKNGIVESIITVKGVPKTIIEPAHNWDENSRLIDPTDDEDLRQDRQDRQDRQNRQNRQDRQDRQDRHDRQDRQDRHDHHDHHDEYHGRSADYVNLDNESDPERSNLVAVTPTKNGPRLR